jgi:hypothetical protein
MNVCGRRWPSARIALGLAVVAVTVVTAATRPQLPSSAERACREQAQTANAEAPAPTAGKIAVCSARS